MTDKLDLVNGSLVVPGSSGLKKLKLPQGDRLQALIGEITPGRHVGFAMAWGDVLPQVETWAARLPAGTPFVFAGHSLGGALAQLGAYDFASRKRADGTAREVAAVVTFGAPAVGNKEFSDSYNGLLKPQTVRIEATADLVPDLLRSWYYGLFQSQRDFLRSGLALTTLHDRTGQFTPVGLGWRFPQQPPLSVSDFNAVIAAVKKALDDAQRKQEAPAKNSPVPATKPPPGSPLKPSGQGATPSAAGPSSGAASANDAVALALLFVVVGAAVLLGAWIFFMVFKKSKIAAHAINEHYALYLSTLSYQQIRKLYGGNLDQANAKLEPYLRFIRGADGVAFFKDYEKNPLPLPLKPEYQIATFIAHDASTNIC